MPQTQGLESEDDLCPGKHLQFPFVRLQDAPMPLEQLKGSTVQETSR